VAKFRRPPRLAKIVKSGTARRSRNRCACASTARPRPLADPVGADEQHRPHRSQVLSAVLAGRNRARQRLDEAYAIPTEEAMKIALRTQQIIPRRRGGNVVDPLGGSYYVESLTNALERDLRHPGPGSAMAAR